MGRKFSRTKPLRPTEPVTDWHYFGLKYWTRNGDPKSPKVRQEPRVELHYHTPPKVKRRRKRVSGVASASGQQAADTRKRIAELREEQETLLNSLRMEHRPDEMHGSVTPVRRRELAEGFAAAGMAHLVF